MTAAPHRLAVVYLCRHVNPVWKARAFLDSFFRNDPGPDTPLYFLHKGHRPGTLDPAVLELPERLRARLRYLWTDDEGHMDRAFAFAARELSDFTHLLLLTSNAIILVPEWLRLYRNAMERTGGRALIGATGSWEAMERLGVTFPNPHIRTTGFLVSRERFLELPADRAMTKLASYHMESGPDGLTNQYLKAGDPVFVLDRHGRLYPPEEWPDSRTFRNWNQENLVIADLKTTRYHYLGRPARVKLARRCWGDHARVTGGFPLSLIPYRIWYKHLYHGYRFRWLTRLVRGTPWD